MGWLGKLLNKNEPKSSPSHVYDLQAAHLENATGMLELGQSELPIKSGQEPDGKIVTVKEHTRTLTNKSSANKPNQEVFGIDAKNAVNNGTQTVLGDGFASSQALRDRGFREGAECKSSRDLELSLELLTNEYRAHIHNKINQQNEYMHQHMQGWSRMKGISESYDKSIEVLVQQVGDKVEQLKSELLDLEQLKGAIVGIHIAYRKGYVQAIELGGFKYFDPNQ